MITSERPRGLFPRFTHGYVSTFFFADLRLCQQKKSADSAFFTTTRKEAIFSGSLTVEKKVYFCCPPITTVCVILFRSFQIVSTFKVLGVFPVTNIDSNQGS